jgi:phosphatidylserine/phosphatidylglycerophosphate/cardiolipin synthase-like enzyme
LKCGSDWCEKVADQGYSGNQSHIAVEKLLAGGGDLRIITPYIDAFYARKLLGYAGRGKVFLITYNAPNNREALAILSRGKQPGALLAAAYFAALAVLLWIASLHGIAMVSTALAAGVILLYILVLRPRASRNLSRIKVKVMHSLFVHEKIYIGNAMAIVGSANLTYNGMHKNIEHIESISDPVRIAELRRHFDDLLSTER